MTGEMKDALLPCLRCGGPLSIHENDWCEPSMWSFDCQECGLRGKEWPTSAEAVTDANRRPLPSTDKAVVELREALEKAAGWFDDYAREHHEKAQRFERLGMHPDATTARTKGGTNAARAFACREALTASRSTGTGEG